MGIEKLNQMILDKFNKLIENDEITLHIEIKFGIDWKIVIIHKHNDTLDKFNYYISHLGDVTDYGLIIGDIGDVYKYCEEWTKTRRIV
jgi:hypothetical protein